MHPYNPHLKSTARRLRRDMTDAEQRLWHYVRRRQIHGVQFYRQKPLGAYIVDFFAPAIGLVLEVDGGQHCDAATARKDAQRSEMLARMGLTVLRFDNLQVLRETDAVLDALWAWVAQRLASAG